MKIPKKKLVDVRNDKMEKNIQKILGECPINQCSVRWIGFLLAEWDNQSSSFY
jgi:hypothetical protein